MKPEDLNAMVQQHWPECRFECEQISQHAATASLAVSAQDIRPGGYVCGPTLFAAADAAMWFLAAVASGRPEPMALTSDLAIRYLTPAQGQRVYARAELNKATRRTLVASVSIWMDEHCDQPSAIAQGAYVLPANP